MKDIKNYEGLYAVTSCGKVYSYKNKIFLKPNPIKNNYLQVTLYKNGIRKNFLVHRLVAEAYLPNPNNLSEVNHKNENKKDNYLNNLEWCDRINNCNYGSRNQKISKAVGQYTKTGEFIAQFNSISEAGRITGININCISRCCRGNFKTAGKYVWKFISEE